jgi:archaeosine-15-forming tRNA-guanine transglycosylase
MTPQGEAAAKILARAFKDPAYRVIAQQEMRTLALAAVDNQAEREICDAGTSLNRLVTAGQARTISDQMTETITGQAQ